MRHPDQDAQLDLDPKAGLSPAALEVQDDLEGDTLREECGVFGIYGHPDAAAITALGLHALQHRGQEAAGIVSFDGKRFHSERRMGLAAGEVVADEAHAALGVEAVSYTHLTLPTIYSV